MKFGIYQINSPTPSQVVKIIAALTLIFQALPHTMAASPVVSKDAVEVVALCCDMANIFVVAAATFFGVTPPASNP